MKSVIELDSRIDADNERDQNRIHNLYKLYQDLGHKLNAYKESVEDSYNGGNSDFKYGVALDNLRFATADLALAIEGK